MLATSTRQSMRRTQRGLCFCAIIPCTPYVPRTYINTYRIRRWHIAAQHGIFKGTRPSVTRLEVVDGGAWLRGDLRREEDNFGIHKVAPCKGAGHYPVRRTEYSYVRSSIDASL